MAEELSPDERAEAIRFGIHEPEIIAEYQADVDQLDGATEPGEPDTWATSAGMFAARWNLWPQDRREAFVGRVVNDSARAARCREADHDGEIDRLRTVLLDVTFVREVGVPVGKATSATVTISDPATPSGIRSDTRSVTEAHSLCPECVAGKHRNCIGWTLDAEDNMIDCECEECAMIDITTLITELRELRDKLSAHEVAALDRAADALEAIKADRDYMVINAEGLHRSGVELRERAEKAEQEVASFREQYIPRLTRAEQERDAAVRTSIASEASYEAELAEMRKERDAALAVIAEALAEHVEGVMYADDIPEGTDYLPGTTDPIPDDYERHYCEMDGEDWPCSLARILSAVPGDVLREHDECVWDEGCDAGFDAGSQDGSVPGNPYRQIEGSKPDA